LKDATKSEPFTAASSTLLPDYAALLGNFISLCMSGLDSIVLDPLMCACSYVPLIYPSVSLVQETVDNNRDESTQLLKVLKANITWLGQQTSHHCSSCMCLLLSLLAAVIVILVGLDLIKEYT
jgi:hypothetical protein